MLSYLCLSHWACPDLVCLAECGLPEVVVYNLAPRRSPRLKCGMWPIAYPKVVPMIREPA
jgi:hypothetical protein